MNGGAQFCWVLAGGILMLGIWVVVRPYRPSAAQSESGARPDLDESPPPRGTKKVRVLDFAKFAEHEKAYQAQQRSKAVPVPAAEIEAATASMWESLQDADGPMPRSYVESLAEAALVAARDVRLSASEPIGNRTMRIGTRVRIVSDDWPERYGCEGWVVAGPTHSGSQVAVKLDADPLFDPRYCDPDRGWSCICQRRMLERIQ